jgi:LAO/AO transport system kinase
MKPNAATDTLARDILAGSPRALSRGLTIVESGGEGCAALLDELYSYTGRAHIVGITGSPGSGKSTLTSSLTRVARQEGLTVGIIAVDPSSPFSGGAILGDRIRMNEVACEPDVFVRSLATHGALGGLSRATADSVDLMDVAGKNVIFVETVGVGQDEVDIMQVVHTVVVVSVPGLGDEIQALKAGVLEIADIHVVNKADREGANRIQAELRSMLALGQNSGHSWQPPILASVAIRDEGVAAVFNAIRDHREALRFSGEFGHRRERMVRGRILGLAHDLLNEAAVQQEYDSTDLTQRVLRYELTPHAAGRILLKQLSTQRRF